MTTVARRHAALAVLATGVLLLAGTAACGRDASPPEAPGAGAAAPAGSATTGTPEVAPTAQPLLVTPTAEETRRTLASLRKVDDHPLYEMTYEGPAPGVAGEPGPSGTPTARGAGTGATPDGAATAGGTSVAGGPAAGEFPAGRGAFACTVFLAGGDPDRMLVGRNFDWDHNPALLLHARPRGGYASVSLVDISYLGFGAGRLPDLADPTRNAALARAVAIPFDGMNEKGLAIGMAALDDAVTEVRPGRPTVGSIGVMRLALDRAATVDEAVEVFRSYTVDFTDGPPLHYLIADATGAAAVIEYVAGRMRVLPRSGAWHLMTNFPLATTPVGERGGDRRYRIAAGRLDAAAGRLAPRAAMDLLRDVAQSHTQWSVVYDLTSRTAQVVTDKRSGSVRSFRLAG